MRKKKFLAGLFLSAWMLVPFSSAFAYEQEFQFTLYYQGGPEVEHTAPQNKPDGEPALYAYLTYINYQGQYCSEGFKIWGEESKYGVFHSRVTGFKTLSGIGQKAYCFYTEGGGKYYGKPIRMAIERKGWDKPDKTIGVGGKFEP